MSTMALDANEHLVITDSNYGTENTSGMWSSFIVSEKETGISILFGEDLVSIDLAKLTI